MLQYESKNRLTCEQLIHHKFLTENMNNFHKIDLNLVSNKIQKNQLKINIKKNQSVWAIFNQEDENKLMKINPEQLTFISDMKENHNINEQITFNPPKIYDYINNEKSNEQFIKPINAYQVNDIEKMYIPYYNEIKTENYNTNQNYSNDEYVKEINYFFDDGIFK